MKGQELDCTLVEPSDIVLASITPLIKLPPIVTPPVDLPIPEVPVEPTIPLTGQTDDAAFVDTKFPST